MDETKAIYKPLYWDNVRGDDLPVGVDLAVFDFAVNSGVTRASKVLQGLVGVTQDGHIGTNTLHNADVYQFGLVDKLYHSRLEFLKTLKIWSTFGHGWELRVKTVRALAKKMRRIYYESIHH